MIMAGYGSMGFQSLVAGAVFAAAASAASFQMAAPQTPAFHDENRKQVLISICQASTKEVEKDRYA
jgi:hypothetical protein